VSRIKSLLALVELAARPGQEGDALALCMDVLRDMNDVETVRSSQAVPRRAVSREQVRQVLDLSETHSPGEVTRLTDVNRWSVRRIRQGQTGRSRTARKSASQLSVAEMTDIIQCFDEGLTVNDISFAYDLDYNTVYNVAKRKNLTARGIGRHLDRNRYSSGTEVSG